MLNLERLGNITAELSANLVKSIVLPGGLLGRLTRPLTVGGKLETKADGETAAKQALPAGPLVLVGGCPVPDEVVVQMIHLCGGRGARLAVVPVGVDGQDNDAAEKVKRLFSRFGMRSVETLEIVTRERANNPYWADKLVGFDAVALYSDMPDAALEVLGGSLCAGVLHQISALGRPIIGFGAGGAILAERCLLANGATAAGLGLAPRMIIDGSSGELPILLQAVGSQQSAQFLGIGLENGTALFVRDGEARVLGDRTVTFVDGRETMSFSDGTDASSGAGPVCGVRVHVLVSGCSLNLKSRKPAAPVREPAQVAGG